MTLFPPRSVSRAAVALALLFAFLAFGASRASADVDLSNDTTSALTHVIISNQLNCSVNHLGDASGEFYSDSDCATELSFNGELYGPDNLAAGNSPTAYTPVSQTTRSGAGTAGSPYQVVTVVDAVPSAGGSADARVTETDTYVIGQESYTTTIQVQNLTGAQATGQIYHGGDCYLQNSDFGFGRVDGNAISCVNGVDDGTGTTIPGPRIEQFQPLTAGSHFYEDEYGMVWDHMTAQTAFGDVCTCSTYQDNGAGLSWAFTLGAGQSTTKSLLTTFSPTGNQPLQTSKVATAPSASAGASDGYTITVTNPNGTAANLTSIVDTLPAGFTYTPGSTTGATTANPTINGQELTWTGSFSVPAHGTTTLHFGVTVSSTPGTYFNNATGTADAISVLPTGDTAPITVT